MFNRIKKQALALYSDKNKRDWGRSITLRSDNSNVELSEYFYREKFLTLNPKASIILESHAKYSEVWVANNSFEYYLEDGNGQVIKQVAKKFERIFIQKGLKHKIINPNETLLDIFEIQIGQIKDDDKTKYFKEDKNVQH